MAVVSHLLQQDLIFNSNRSRAQIPMGDACSSDPSLRKICEMPSASAASRAADKQRDARSLANKFRG